MDYKSLFIAAFLLAFITTIANRIMEGRPKSKTALNEEKNAIAFPPGQELELTQIIPGQTNAVFLKSYSTIPTRTKYDYSRKNYKYNAPIPEKDLNECYLDTGDLLRIDSTNFQWIYATITRGADYPRCEKEMTIFFNNDQFKFKLWQK